MGEEKPGGDDSAWFHPGGVTNKRGEKEGQDAYVGEGDKELPVSKNVGLFNFTPVCIDKNRGMYVFMLEPNEDADYGVLEVFLSAETQKYNAPIKNAALINGQALDVNDNKIKGLSFRSNEQLRIRVELDYYDYCSLEVNIYATKK